VNFLALVLYKIFSFRYPLPLFDHWQNAEESSEVKYTDPLFELEPMTEEELVALEGLKRRKGGFLSAIQPTSGVLFKQGGNRGLASAAKSVFE